MEKLFDAHLHYYSGTREDMESLILNSPYREVYFAYNSVNLKSLCIDSYLHFISGAFLFPFFLKETDITEANDSLFDYTKQCPSYIYPIPLIDETGACIQYIENSIGAKEHFMLHNAFACEKREKAYRLLNKQGKFLILHCGDNVRDNYVDYLLERYSTMKIILTHLGANRRDNNHTQQTLQRFSSNSRVYFDTSSIHDPNILTIACSIIPNNRLLFGSDMPFIMNDDPISSAIGSISKLSILESTKEAILFNNAINLINTIK